MLFSKLAPRALSAVWLASTATAEAIPLCDHQAATSPSVGTTRDLFLKHIFAKSPGYGDFYGKSSSRGSQPLKVGIIGAGVTGLYAALILDTLGIDYDILESSERVGGRIFTYRFNETAWEASKPGEPDYYDYYDVGAMRIPGMAWMDRLIGKANNSLIPYINSKLGEEELPVKLMPYIFQANNTFRLFNDRLAYNQVTPSAQTFGIHISDYGNRTVKDEGFFTMSPSTVLSDVLGRLVQGLKDFDKGFELLMQYDKTSLREHLESEGYSAQQITWMETVTDATTHFDTMSLMQAVIENWIFTEAPLDSWLCVEGGMDRITHGMTKILRKSVEMKKRVTAIKPASNCGLTVVINGTEQRTYDHVINTVPLGAMQVMDMTELHLGYHKNLAIRELQYDPAGKIGIKFKTRWWEKLESGSFQGGQSFTDLPIRRCVYPSYGLDTPDAPGTIIASYTWGQDSMRLGAYYHDDAARANVVELTLRNLAAMHNVTYDLLRAEFVDAHLWDWYATPDAVGAYALFGPDEFSSVLPTLMRPAASGRLHFAGEALSSGHAWIIGGLNSAYRAVAGVLAVEGMVDKGRALVDAWGLVDEADMGWVTRAGEAADDE